MSDLLTPELAAKVEQLFADRGAPGIDAQALASALAKDGIALVDGSRSTFLVDVRVHEGALWRSGLYRQRVEQADAWAAHLTPAKGVWRRLSQQTMPCGDGPKCPPPSSFDRSEVCASR